MILATSLAFFFLVFLVASIAAAVLFLAFLKMKAEESEAAQMDAALSDPRNARRQEQGVALDAGEVGLEAVPSPLLRSERLSTITFWDHVLARFDFGELLKTQLEQSEVDWSVGRITSMMLLLGIVVLAGLLPFLPAWVALLVAVGTAFAPYAYVLHRRNVRFHKFRENFPDTLDSLARALRAGYPLSSAMDMISGEATAPVAGELKRTSTEANLGRGWPQALENLGQRVPILEVNTFIAAVQLHSRTGGRLSEVMSNLAEQMRETLALQGEVRALAAHGKLTGLILTILPLAIAAMMVYVSPGYMSVLLDHPLGKTLITVAAACLVLAHFVIRKIVDIRI